MIDTLATLVGKLITGAIDHGIEAAQNLGLDSAALLERVRVTLLSEGARVDALLASREKARAEADAAIEAARPTPPAVAFPPKP